VTPPFVDWRSRWGQRWLTRIKDQQGCADCYIFGGVGVVEAMVRIEHGLWSLRSEGDVGDSISLYSGAKGKGTGGSPEHVLEWIVRNGVADPGCWPSLNTTQVGAPSPDRPGRTVKLDGFEVLSGHAAMKTWIATNGPLAACFTCYPEFHTACTHDKVYVYSNPKKLPGDGHCVIVVGYDDAKQAWLIRNSWGTGWGTDGYGWFGYGQGDKGLEHQACFGVVGSHTNPDPWSSRRMHSGGVLESGEGALHRDLEVWARGSGRSINRYRRDGTTMAWSLVETLPEVTLPNGKKGNECAGPPTVIASTYDRNFDLAYQAKSHQLRSMLYEQEAKRWRARALFGPSDVAGIPGFLQMNDGAPGNFEVVVRTKKGELENWARDDLGNTGKWERKHTFATNVLLSGATFVQRWVRGDGAPDVTGGLYRDYWRLPAGVDVVCVNDDHSMQRWWRDDPNTQAWVACETFGSDVKSPPVMIRSQFGASDETVPGNYELCVAVDGSLQHWWTPGSPEPKTAAMWTHSATVATDVPGTKVKKVLGLVQTSFGFDLEVIAELSNGSLQHFWRDGAGWHAGHVLP
jgi:hypothetical protein